MAVETNYNVKVQLDPTSFPTDNKVVIWDPDSGSFALTGSYGSGGGTTGVIVTDGTTTVDPSTTLDFNGAVVTDAGSNQATIDIDLQSVTDNGDNTTRQIKALDGTLGNYANQPSLDATSGFLKVGSNVYTHVTPQLTDKRTTLLSISSDVNDDPLEYPDNYVVYSYVRITPDTSDTSGTSGTSGGGTDASYGCTNRYVNTSNLGENKLFLNTVSIGDTISIITNILTTQVGYTPVVNDIVLLKPENANPVLNNVTATVATVNMAGNTTFTVTDVAWDSSSTNGPDHIWCLELIGVRSLTLELGGGNELGQIALMRAASGSEGTGSEDPRSGMLLTSAGNIFYFKPDAKRNTSGSFQIPSASAKISFNAGDSSIDFKINGDSDPSAIYKPMLYVSKSGDDARIGIGTDKPTSIFEVKTQQGSSKEAPDFVLSVPSGSVAEGAESSRIAFLIEDTTLSGSKLNISGSTAAIYSKVLGSQAGYQYGSLVLEVDGGSVATQDTKAFEIGYGLNSSINGSQIGTIISSSILMDGISTPSIQMRASGNDIIRIGRDTTSPFTPGGELYIYYDGNAEVALRTYTEDSFISSSAGKGFGIGTKTPNAKLDVVGSGIFTGSLNVSQSFTASGLNYPDTDGLDRQVIKTDGLGNLSFGYTENTQITIKNVSGGTINKGTPCFITASGTSGNVAGVIPADAGDFTKMPAGVIAGETLLDEAEGVGLVNGFIQGVNTSAFTSGDTVYVAVGGGYTNVKPTGSLALVQKLGNVEKVDASNGSGVINGPGYYNDLPNWEEGKIQVGTSTYPVTSSVISLDETNKYVSGSESAKFKLGTYAFGYNTFPGFGFDVTGSGIIVSSSLPDEHYPMVKIGETELLDLTTDTALSDHTFTIHNVDNFQVTSGSEPTDVSTNKLFEHIGDIFKVYSKGNSTPVFTASSSSIALQGVDVNILPSSGVPNVKIPNTSTAPQYVPVFDSDPSGISGRELKYITSSTFIGGNVNNTGTPLDNQIAVWTDATTIEGTSKLTFSNSTLHVESANVTGAGIKIYGGVYPSARPYISPVGADTVINFGDGSSGHVFDFLNNKIAFDGDSTNTYIQANTDTPEDLEIHADQDIILAADNAVVIGAVTDVEERISSYRVAIMSNGFYSQADLRYLTYNTTTETTSANTYISIIPAAANGRVISVTCWPQSSGGSSVLSFYVNGGTASATDTQTLTSGVPVQFTFSSGNTFSALDELAFSIDPTNTPNGLSFQIILEYDY